MVLIPYPPFILPFPKGDIQYKLYHAMVMIRCEGTVKILQLIVPKTFSLVGICKDFL